MATPRERVPGLLLYACATSGPSVMATAARVSKTASSMVSPRVFTSTVWPLTSAPGPWPVCSVVTPNSRTHSTSFSRALYASTARSEGWMGSERSSWSWSWAWFR